MRRLIRFVRRSADRNYPSSRKRHSRIARLENRLASPRSHKRYEKSQGDRYDDRYRRDRSRNEDPREHPNDDRDESRRRYRRNDRCRCNESATSQ